jgi:hypothetical protein
LIGLYFFTLLRNHICSYSDSQSESQLEAKSEANRYSMCSKYESDEEIVDRNLDMKARTIYNISKTKALVKITVKEFIQCVGNWIYNREIDANKVKELKEQYIANNGNDYFNIMDNDKENDISPAWIISIVYDKEATGVNNLFVIDGQHRREVIRELLEEGLIWDTIEIVCIMYSIDNCYKQNKKTTLELFKKINNNLQLKDTDFPKILATQVVEAIEKEKELVSDIKRVIKNDGNNKSGIAREPFIHKAELFQLFNKNYSLYENLSPEEVIANLKIIARKIRYKDYETIYQNPTSQNSKYYEKARDNDFWLNLKSSDKCKPDEWIKYIANPTEFIP